MLRWNFYCNRRFTSCRRILLFILFKTLLRHHFEAPCCEWNSFPRTYERFKSSAWIPIILRCFASDFPMQDDEWEIIVNSNKFDKRDDAVKHDNEEGKIFFIIREENSNEATSIIGSILIMTSTEIRVSFSLSFGDKVLLRSRSMLCSLHYF